MQFKVACVIFLLNIFKSVRLEAFNLFEPDSNYKDGL